MIGANRLSHVQSRIGIIGKDRGNKAALPHIRNLGRLGNVCIGDQRADGAKGFGAVNDICCHGGVTA